MDKLICVGKNFVAHALELGDVVPTEPIYFLKPPSALCAMESGRPCTVVWPKAGGELHHEVELVLRLGLVGDRWIFTHYTVGLDMTLRDVQARLKKSGLPWEKAKVFSNAAVIAPWFPLNAPAALADVMNQTLSLKVNGNIRQSARPAEMRFSPTFVLEDLPRHFPLREGDVLFTGTLEGVGPIEHGDQLVLRLGDHEFHVEARRE